MEQVVKQTNFWALLGIELGLFAPESKDHNYSATLLLFDVDFNCGEPINGKKKTDSKFTVFKQQCILSYYFKILDLTLFFLHL